MGPRRSSGSLKALVLIDGEHYPPVIARALERLPEGIDVSDALIMGGGEKLGAAEFDLGVPVHDVRSDPEAGLSRLIASTGAELVYDLSDEPVLGYELRFRCISIALWKGASYAGAGFRFDPPALPKLTSLPSIRLIGTGKRTGKTALSGALARDLTGRNIRSVIVAMGRGGPAEPEVIEAGTQLTSKVLLDLAGQGRHAASDHLEDALTSGVATVGAWRAGGGLSGEVEFTSFSEAVARANELGPQMLIFEGSGASVPPAEASATLLAVDCRMDPAHLRGYLGLYRVLLSDLVVLTMCEESIDRERISALESCIRSGPSNPPRILRTIFRPHPLGEVSGKKIWLATTAPPSAAPALEEHLASRHGARIVGVTHALADRTKLLSELEKMPRADAVAVELKAAAVDVVTKFGTEQGMEVIYLDNRPIVTGQGGPSLQEAFTELSETASERAG